MMFHFFCEHKPLLENLISMVKSMHGEHSRSMSSDAVAVTLTVTELIAFLSTSVPLTEDLPTASVDHLFFYIF